MAGKDFHTGNSRYCPSGYADTPTRPGDWRNLICDTDALQSINRAGSNNYSKDAKESGLAMGNGNQNVNK